MNWAFPFAQPISRISFLTILAGFSLFFLAAYLRLYQLDLRPMHNDEGVNHHFVEEANRKGYYPYSHLNYHGPSYFYALQGTTAVLGDDEFGMRFVGVLFGLILVAMPLVWSRELGKSGTLVAIGLLAISPSLVFYARYAIHETLFLLGTAWFALESFRAVVEDQQRSFLWAGVALALLITTKETFVISLFVLLLALLAAREWRVVIVYVLGAVALAWYLFVVTPLPSTGGHDLVKVYADGLHSLVNERDLFFIGLVALVWLGTSWYSWHGLFDVVQKHYQSILWSITICVVLTFVCFSGGFQWLDGVHEMVKAVQQWVGRAESDHGHFKPFVYYLEVWWKTESVLVIAAVSGVLVLLGFPCEMWRLLKSEDSRFLRFTLVWSGVSLFVYSFVKYKTPWLVINITFPAVLALAWSLGRIGILRPYGTWCAAVFGVLHLLIGGYQSYHYNFQLPYGNRNPFSYVHTRQGMLDFVNDVGEYWSKHADARVLVGVAQYWPLPYYFRSSGPLSALGGGGIGYQKTDDPLPQQSSHEIILVDKTSTWNPPGWIKKYYRLSDVQEAFGYFRIGGRA